jgi:hypothetical protein
VRFKPTNCVRNTDLAAAVTVSTSVVAAGMMVKRKKEESSACLTASESPPSIAVTAWAHASYHRELFAERAIVSVTLTSLQLRLGQIRACAWSNKSNKAPSSRTVDTNNRIVALICISWLCVRLCSLGGQTVTLYRHKTRHLGRATPFHKQNALLYMRSAILADADTDFTNSWERRFQPSQA